MSYGNYMNDTIAALSTPQGIGAIAVIRISGKKAFRIFSNHFQATVCKSTERKEKKKSATQSRIVGFIKDGDTLIDEVVVSLYKKPCSYTGEDVVEISCHCNSYIIKEIMRLILKEARLASPGEFTQRAFLNHKMDLTQAEAVGDLLNVKTATAHQTALSQLKGSLNKNICSLLESLTQCRIALELEIDFTEQDLPEIDVENLNQKLNELMEKMQLLISSGKEGILIREGIVVCLAGTPNVGKSSLFNKLLETDRAIVTAEPGTTRDYLEESLSIDGYLVRLTDTAGLREQAQEVEALGIGISLTKISSADKIIYIEDGTKKNIQEETIISNIALFTDNSKVIKVLNKSDILDNIIIEEYEQKGFLPVSAKTGFNIDILKKQIISELQHTEIEEGILTNIRQINAVVKALEAINHAIISLDQRLGIEFTAFDLKTASESLEEVIGKITDEDLLNSIFDNFCIGK